MNESISNLYGFPGEFEESLIRRISGILQIKFEEHSSGYWGDYWIFVDDSMEDNNIRIYLNKDPMFDPKLAPQEDKFFEFEHKDCETLLELYGPITWVTEVESLLQRIENIKLIKTEY